MFQVKENVGFGGSEEVKFSMTILRLRSLIRVYISMWFSFHFLRKDNWFSTILLDF